MDFNFIQRAKLRRDVKFQLFPVDLPMFVLHYLTLKDCVALKGGPVASTLATLHACEVGDPAKASGGRRDEGPPPRASCRI